MEQKHYVCLHEDHERESVQSPCYPGCFNGSSVLLLSKGLTSDHYKKEHQALFPTEI